ncbi:MAG: DUF4383 domain-containing protein [Pseudonocardiaceae bacterium]
MIEGVLLIGLGVWGLVADATYPDTGPAGAPVLVFHFTTLHSGVLLVTGLLAVISARHRRTALIFTGFQFGAYTLLFAVGSVAFARSVPTTLGFDPGDSVLHLIVAAVGAALYLWLAAQILQGQWWIRDQTRPGRDDMLPPRTAVQQRPPLTYRYPEHASPGDSERFAPGLQDDSRLERVKLGAGVVSVVALVAMSVTSLRSPSIAPTVVLAAVAVGLSVKISVWVARRHRAGSALPPGG